MECKANYPNKPVAASESKKKTLVQLPAAFALLGLLLMHTKKTTLAIVTIK